MPPKILLRKKTVPPATPKKTLSKLSPVDVLTQTLISIDLGEGRYLTPEQVKTLLALEFPDKTNIITTNHPEIILDVINMLQKLSYEFVINYLRNATNAKDLVMNSPLLENERERVVLEIENLQKTIEAEEGIYQCEGCGSQKTVSIQKQVRSADEPMSTFVRCLGCRKRWRID